MQCSRGSIWYYLHQQGSNLGKHRVPCLVLTSALDAQLGTPYSRSAGFDTDKETLYHEDHGATLKRKCGKRIVALSLFYFFIWPFFFCPFFFYLSFLSFFFFFLGQCSINDDHHTSIFLQLNDYNSILEQDMTLYECLRRCTRMCNDS